MKSNYFPDHSVAACSSYLHERVVNYHFKHWSNIPQACNCYFTFIYGIVCLLWVCKSSNQFNSAKCESWKQNSNL